MHTQRGSRMLRFPLLLDLAATDVSRLIPNPERFARSPLGPAQPSIESKEGTGISVLTSNWGTFAIARRSGINPSAPITLKEISNG